MGLVRDGTVTAVISWDLASELADVLARPSIRRYDITDRDIRDVMASLAPWLPTVDVDVELRDPKDAPVVAAAIAGNAEAIVTGDRDLLADEALSAWLAEREVGVLSPRSLLERLGLEPYE